MKCHVQVRCVVATCLMVCAASGVDAPEAVGRMHPRQATKGTGTLTSLVVEVPMDTSTRQPLIEVKIDGKGPFKFVIDSGAGFNAVDDDLVEKLALGSFGTAEAGDGSGKPMKMVSIVRLGTVSFGGASFADQRAVVIDFDGPYRSDDRPDGIIGLGTTAEFLTTFDYPREKLVLTRGSLPPADDKDILRYQQRGHGIPTLPLTVAGREVSVAIDTGASSGCVLEQSLEGSVPTKSAPVLVGIARRAISEAKIRAARIDGPLVLGRHVIDNPITSFGGIQSLIGYDVLRHFAITFDAQAKTVRFAREGR